MKLKKTLTAFGLMAITATGVLAGPPAATAMPDDERSTTSAAVDATDRISGKFVTNRNASGALPYGSVYHSDRQADVVLSSHSVLQEAVDYADMWTFPAIGTTGPVSSVLAPWLCITPQHEFFLMHANCNDVRRQQFRWVELNGDTAGYGLQSVATPERYIGMSGDRLYLLPEKSASVVLPGGKPVTEQNVAPVVITTPASGATVRTAQPTFAGTGERGARIEIVDAQRQRVAPVVTVDDAGTWSTTASSGFPAGAHAGSVQQSVSQESTSVPWSFTYAAVEPVSFTAPAEGSNVEQQQPTISGVGDAGAKVTVVDQTGATLVDTTVDKNGAWSQASLQQLTPDTAYSLTATQLVEGAPGSTTAQVNFTFQKKIEVPVVPLEVTSPKAGSTIDTDRPTFTGTGQPGAQVTITDAAGAVLVDTTVAANGSWKQESKVALAEGAVKATAAQVFEGATTTVQVNFTYQKALLPPVASMGVTPTLAPGASGSARILVTNPNARRTAVGGGLELTAPTGTTFKSANIAWRAHNNGGGFEGATGVLSADKRTLTFDSTDFVVNANSDGVIEAYLRADAESYVYGTKTDGQVRFTTDGAAPAGTKAPLGWTSKVTAPVAEIGTQPKIAPGAVGSAQITVTNPNAARTPVGGGLVLTAPTGTTFDSAKISWRAHNGSGAFESETGVLSKDARTLTLASTSFVVNAKSVGIIEASLKASSPNFLYGSKTDGQVRFTTDGAVPVDTAAALGWTSNAIVPVAEMGVTPTLIPGASGAARITVTNPNAARTPVGGGIVLTAPTGTTFDSASIAWRAHSKGGGFEGATGVLSADARTLTVASTSFSVDANGVGIVEAYLRAGSGPGVSSNDGSVTFVAPAGALPEGTSAPLGWVAADVAMTPVVVDAPLAGSTLWQPAGAADARPPFSGTGEPGAKVTVVRDGRTFVDTEVRADGTWSQNSLLAVPVSVDPVSFTATQTKPGRVSNQVDVSFTVRSAESASALRVTSPQIGAQIDERTPVFTGTGQPGARIEIRGASGAVLGEVESVSDDGTWSITWNKELLPNRYVGGTVKQYVPGVSAATHAFMYDFTIRAEQLAPLVVTSPKVGATITETTPVFTGTAQPGARIEIRGISGDLLGSVPSVAADGTWSITWNKTVLPNRYAGGTVKQIVNGVATHKFVYDFTIAQPSAPLVVTTPSAGGTLVAGVPVFTGTGQPGAKIEIRGAWGGVLGTVDSVAANGKWSITWNKPLLPAHYSGGTVKQFVKGIETHTFVYDFTVVAASGLVVTSPKVGETITGTRPVFTGTATPGARITITGAWGTDLGSATADLNGAWSITWPSDYRPAKYSGGTVSEILGGKVVSTFGYDFTLAP